MSAPPAPPTPAELEAMSAGVMQRTINNLHAQADSMPYSPEDYDEGYSSSEEDAEIHQSIQQIKKATDALEKIGQEESVYLNALKDLKSGAEFAMFWAEPKIVNRLITLLSEDTCSAPMQDAISGVLLTIVCASRDHLAYIVKLNGLPLFLRLLQDQHATFTAKANVAWVLANCLEMKTAHDILKEQNGYDILLTLCGLNTEEKPAPANKLLVHLLRALQYLIRGSESNEVMIQGVESNMIMHTVPIATAIILSTKQNSTISNECRGMAIEILIHLLQSEYEDELILKNVRRVLVQKGVVARVVKDALTTRENNPNRLDGEEGEQEDPTELSAPAGQFLKTLALTRDPLMITTMLQEGVLDVLVLLFKHENPNAKVLACVILRITLEVDKSVSVLSQLAAAGSEFFSSLVTLLSDEERCGARSSTGGQPQMVRDYAIECVEGMVRNEKELADAGVAGANAQPAAASAAATPSSSSSASSRPCTHLLRSANIIPTLTALTLLPPGPSPGLDDDAEPEQIAHDEGMTPDIVAKSKMLLEVYFKEESEDATKKTEAPVVA